MLVLRTGSRGAEVHQLQTLLGIPADGIFGPQTARAVREFQASKGLVVDGIVGPATWGAFSNTTPSKPVPTPPISTGASSTFTRGNARIIKTSADNIEIREIRNTLQGANVNGITAGFFWPLSPTSAQHANGVIVQGGNIIGHNAAHAWRGFGQWVLCYYTNHTFGVEFVKTAAELSRPVIWAFGGVSLFPHYDPAKEGFTGAYSDVMRRVTSRQGGHCWIGIKGSDAYLYWRTNCTRAETREDGIELGMDYIIGCDGGGSAQIRHPQLTNAHTSRRINTAFTLKQL